MLQAGRKAQYPNLWRFRISTSENGSAAVAFLCNMSGKAQGDEAVQARLNQKKKREKDFKEVFDLFDSDGGVRHLWRRGLSHAKSVSPTPRLHD
jgi:hypothetical protein